MASQHSSSPPPPLPSQPLKFVCRQFKMLPISFKRIPTNPLTKAAFHRVSGLGGGGERGRGGRRGGGRGGDKKVNIPLKDKVKHCKREMSSLRTQHYSKAQTWTQTTPPPEYQSPGHLVLPTIRHKLHWYLSWQRGSKCTWKTVCEEGAWIQMVMKSVWYK